MLDAEKPFALADSSFDIVYVRLVLHYLSNTSQQNVLNEIQRVLKSGGIAIVQLKSKNDVLYKEGPKIDMGDGMFYFPTKKNSRNYLAIDELLDKLKASRLEPVEHSEHNEMLYTYESTLVTAICIKPDDKSENSKTSVIRESAALGRIRTDTVFPNDEAEIRGGQKNTPLPETESDSGGREPRSGSTSNDKEQDFVVESDEGLHLEPMSRLSKFYSQLLPLGIKGMIAKVTTGKTKTGSMDSMPDLISLTLLYEDEVTVKVRGPVDIVDRYGDKILELTGRVLKGHTSYSDNDFLRLENEMNVSVNNTGSIKHEMMLDGVGMVDAEKMIPSEKDISQAVKEHLEKVSAVTEKAKAAGLITQVRPLLLSETRLN